MFRRWNRSESRPQDTPVPELLLGALVSSEWMGMVARADEMASVIDRHLEYESARRRRDLAVGALRCEQKVNLVSDLAHFLD